MSRPPHSAEVVVLGPTPRFDTLVQRLGLPRSERAPNDAFCLVEGPSGLELRPPGEAERRGVGARFPPDREPPGQARRSALVRAFGKRTTRVFDLTAGLGADAWRLAAAGFEVDAWERHPALYALLVSGWAEASLGPAAAFARRLRWHHGDGATGLPVAGEADPATCGAYLDPMYPPPRRAAARPKRAAAALRALLGAEPPPEALLARARASCARVVVKRPTRAGPLAHDADYTLETKLVRFDVYVNAGLSGPTSSPKPPGAAVGRGT